MQKKRLLSQLFLTLVMALVLVVTGSQLALAAAEDTDWDAMYAEQIALGQEPITMSAPQSALDAGFPFDYALLTPDTKDVPDSEAFVIVLMGDGFTEADMAKMALLLPVLCQ